MNLTSTPWQPKVSVIIPVYNGSDYLAQAIESALAQTYKNVEVIVVNDGSTDNNATDNLARSFGQRISYYTKPNEGIAKTLNFGIENMTGEYFSWLSHDDVFEKEKIEKQVEMLRGLTNRESIVYSDYYLINNKSEIIGQCLNPHVEPERFYYTLFLRFPVHACTSLIPKVAFAKVGLFDPNWGFLQDTEMWFRMAPYFPFIHIPAKLARVRMHPRQGTVTRSKQGYVEGNLMYSQQMQKLTQEEIKAICGLEPADFYFACDTSFRQKSYYQAANSALRLAQKSLQKKTLKSIVKIIARRMVNGALEKAQKVLRSNLR